MARKSRISNVLEYLECYVKIISDDLELVVKSENYAKADQLKLFRDILKGAIQLCGKGGNNDN